MAIETSTKPTGDEVREAFARLRAFIVHLHESNLGSLASELTDDRQRDSGGTARFLATLATDHDRLVAIVQMNIETVLHDLLFFLQAGEGFRLQAQKKDGEWFNLDEYSDGLHGDLMQWLEVSKYGCISGRMVDFNLESSKEHENRSS